MLEIGLDIGGAAGAAGDPTIQGLRTGFATGRYGGSGVSWPSLTATPGVTFGRIGAGRALRLDGGLSGFADGAARITDRGLLIEEARTNLILRSSALDNTTAWVRTGCTVAANGQLSPDGAVTADSLIEDGSTGLHSLVQATPKQASAVYTFSVFCKPAGRTKLTLYFSTQFNAGGAAAAFTLEGGGAATASGHASTTAAVSAIGDGWYRCVMTATAAADTAAFSPYLFLVNGAGSTSYAGDGVSGVHLWGTQLEIGGFATSPVDTGATTTTRGADSLEFAYPVSAGRDVCEFGEVEFRGDTGAVQTVLELHDGTDDNRITVRRDASGKLGAVATVGGAATLIGETPAAGTRVLKWALSRVGAAWTLVVDGTVVATQGAGVLPTLTARRIGAARAGGAPLNAYARDLRSLPWPLSAAQMQALTA